MKLINLQALLLVLAILFVLFGIGVLVYLVIAISKTGCN